MGNTNSLASSKENQQIVGKPSTDPQVSSKLSPDSLAIIQRFKDVSDDKVDIMTLRGKDFADLLTSLILLQDKYRDTHVKMSDDAVMQQLNDGRKDNPINPQVIALINRYYTANTAPQQPTTTPSPVSTSSLGYLFSKL